MIKTEIVTINDKQFRHVWSSENRYLLRDNQQWEDVYDPIDFEQTYTEGDFIESTEEVTSDDLLNVLLGGTDD